MKNKVELIGWYGGDEAIALFTLKDVKSGIYEIRNIVNNKVYIGSSKNIYKRLNHHISKLNSQKHKNSFLQNSWNKYGQKNFRFLIIEECAIEILLEREQYWMDKTVSYDRNKGFNACVKSHSPLGYKHTEENKLKMSAIKKQQLKEGLIKSNLKRIPNFKYSEEVKNKMRLSKIGDKNPMFGTKLSEEVKKIKGKNMNSVPRWNKGLTKHDDPRLENLNNKKGILPPNAKPHTLIDIQDSVSWTDKSLKHLSEICPLSLSSLNRLKSNSAGRKVTKKYKLIW
jgi:group I intron endonuclease